MEKQEAPWTIEFFTNDSGRSPVEEFIDSLPEDQQVKIEKYLSLLEELGVRIDRSHAKPLKGHKPLWELTPFPNRVLYFMYKDRRIIVLRAFKKSKLKRQRKDIVVAEDRRQKFLENENDKKY